MAESPWPLHRRAVKRAFDLLASSLGLALLLLPLLAIGLLVRASSRGPAFYRQERVGLGGARFRIWKLRTMTADAERRGPAITAAGDARVTPLGRFLRRTKLDELPQLFNVWLGHMSLVGPRPEVPRYVALYPPEMRVVLAVRPGITDPASIEFRHEETLLGCFPEREQAYARELLPRKLTLQREYVETQSFAGDLRLLTRTLAAVLRG